MNPAIFRPKVLLHRHLNKRLPLQFFQFTKLIFNMLKKVSNNFIQRKKTESEIGNSRQQWMDRRHFDWQQKKAHFSKLFGMYFFLFFLFHHQLCNTSLFVHSNERDVTSENLRTCSIRKKYKSFQLTFSHEIQSTIFLYSF